jgi:ABC-type multidrug transport system fused ATPase/permease subunit
MSTIRRAGRILVLENVTVVQVGTFEELARNRGRFAQLMSREGE